MKKFIFLIILASSPSFFSQRCKFEKNEIDKFTNKKVVISKKEKLFSTLTSSGYYSVKQTGDNYYLIFDFIEIKPITEAVSPGVIKYVQIFSGDKLQLLLANNEIITLLSSNSVQSQMKPGVSFGTVSCELYDVEYPITKDQLELLKKTSILTLRIYQSFSIDILNSLNTDQKKSTSVEFHDVDLKKMNQDDIQLLIECILSN
ncbi:MAG: hypothetical protein RL264_1514 [Bacteroidota bacterium]|jgi:hypothetical protein